MTTAYPTPTQPALLTVKSDPPARPAAAPAAGSWRYPDRRQPRVLVVLACLISASLHAGLFFGVTRAKPKVVAVQDENQTLIRLEIPQLKELEEPEPAPTEDTAPPQDNLVPVPMQADLPSLPQPHDFVQPLNFASLLEKPDLSKSNITAIPEHFTRAGRIAESIGKIFNLDDLDRHPEPVLQPSPTYPISQRRDGLSANVIVEFIVDVNGRVLEPIVIDTTHQGFNDAAIAGVSRWKFRAGIKTGRKVNVRMRVPIVFKVLDVVD